MSDIFNIKGELPESLQKEIAQRKQRAKFTRAEADEVIAGFNDDIAADPVGAQSDESLKAMATIIATMAFNMEDEGDD